MVPLTNWVQKLYKDTKVRYTCKEIMKHKYTNDRIYCKVKDYCHYTGKYKGTVQRTYNLKYGIPEEIVVPVVFHNRTNYNYHFVIKELAK